MPSIDVSDVTLDSEIAGEEFSVIRRSTTVGLNGQVAVVPTQIDHLFGCIYPAGDNSLLREEAFQTQMGAITVVTMFRLRGASKDAAGVDYQPDLVVWSGDYYLVRTTNDYSKYGAGFIEAECIEIDWRDTATPVLGAPGALSLSEPEDSQNVPGI